MREGGKREAGNGKRLGDETGMSGSIRSYRNLDVWQVAMRLAQQVYAHSNAMPDTEKFGLVSQMRRAAVSVPSNIAEGYGRGRRREYVRSLTTARGSVCELETQVALAARLDLLDRASARDLWRLARRVNAMLTAQIRALRRSARKDPIDTDAASTDQAAAASPAASRFPFPASRSPNPESRSPEVTP